MSELQVPVQEVIDKLVEVLKAEGSILFSNVPNKIAPYSYSDYSNGQRLKPWLLSFPQFSESSDELSLVLANAEPLEPTPVQKNIVNTPSEVRCMHAFAYMNYWNQNLKHLKNLGTAADVKVDDLRDRFAHILMHDLMTGEIAIDQSDAATPRMYLDTGFTLVSGYPVYAVLEINPRNTDGKKQFWVMKGFSSTADTEQSELGGYLRSYFGVSSGLDYSKVDEQVDRVSDMMASLRPEIETFLIGLDSGACPSLQEGAKLSVLVQDYEQQWSTLLELLEAFPSVSGKKLRTLAEICTVTSKDALRSSLLQQALEAFDTVSNGLEEFFSYNRWLRSENNTLAMDRQLIHSLYDHGASADPKLVQFRETLAFYRNLDTAMSSECADDAFYENLMAAQEHFKELPNIRIAPLVLIVEEENRLFMSGLDRISQLIDQYLSAEPSGKTADTVYLPQDREALLEMALRADREYCRNWPFYIREALPNDEYLQQLIIRDDEPASELTCYAAAQRLLAAGEMDYAERYLILGLLHDKSRIAPALLKLYREEARRHEFEAVWLRYRDHMDVTPEDELYWFGMVCDRSPEQALEAAEKNIQMMYQTPYLTNLITAAETLDRMDLAQTFRTRLEKFAYAAAPNAFETAVISAVPEAIMEAAQPEQLEQLGYNPQQIQTIRNTLESGEYPTGTEAYEIGQRLFKFQGNHNSLAEYWMWQGISKRERSSYAELMLLLSNERRWNEVIWLYEFNEEIQRRYEACRRFYLLSRFFQSPEQAIGVFCENLQDVLVIMKQPGFRDKFEATSATAGNEFYGTLLKLYNAVLNPYLWSVVCEDRSLREHVYDQAQMEALGLNVAKTSEVYRNSKYPHGTDATSIAVRLYNLAGNLACAAETAAQLVGDDHAAISLLWTIYSDEQDETSMYELLVRHEWLRKLHYTAYLDFLYEYGEYTVFLEAFTQEENPGEHQIIERAIAELKTQQPLSDQPNVCAEIALSSSLNLCEDLLRAAAISKETELITEVLCVCFESWMISAPDRIADLVGCCGMADAELLRAIQQKALDNGPMTLAVYLFNCFRIGDIQEQTDSLYDLLWQQMQDQSGPEKLQCIQKLLCLYPEQTDELSVQKAVISIQTLLATSNISNRKDVSEMLALTIRGMNQLPHLLDVVLENMAGSEHCWDYRVYTAIYDWGRQVGRLSDVLLFFHDVAQRTGGEIKNHFRDYLIRMYYNALAEGWFPRQIAEQAEHFCFLAVEQGTSSLAVLCIGMLEQLSGRQIYADAVMLHLIYGTNALQKSPEDMGLENMPAALCPDENHSSSLDLFEQILESSTDAQILEYLTFCSRFVTGDMGALQELRNLEYTQKLTEQQCVYAIDLLCADPENVEYWDLCARIDFNVTNAARARFLHLCCQKNPTHWKKYVQICETDADSFERLPRALAAWSALSKSHTNSCREYLEKQVQRNPEYFANVADQESLCVMVCNLTEKVSSQYRLSKEADRGFLHGQLRAVVEITVSTANQECLQILHQNVGHLLCGHKIDLGVVLISRLLLAGRIEEASQWISRLNTSVATIKYRSLINELSRFDVGQLEQWSLEPSNKTFLQLTLPDGNQPNVDQITSITTDALLDGSMAETANVLKKLLGIFPDDYASTYELMELCVAGFEGSIPMLHFCLLNLLRISDPKDNARIYLSRDRRANTISLAILNQLIVYQRQMDTISDWNFEYTTAQGLENAGVVIRDHGIISRIEQQVHDSLINQPQEIFALRTSAWMANITGNWTEYLKQAFNANLIPPAVFFPEDILIPQGITRSILHLFLQTPIEDRPSLRIWLENLKPFLKRLGLQIDMALTIERKGILDQLNATEKFPLKQILQFPTDNYGLFKNLIRPVMDQMIARGPAHIYPAAFLLCAVGASSPVLNDIVHLAEKYFANGQDEISWCFYSVLQLVSKALNVTHGYHSSYNREEYQTRVRLSGLFAGKEECLTKISSPTLSAWSTLNLVLSLAASSDRSDEINRLISYMSSERAYVARKALMLLDPALSDDQKINQALDPSISKLDQYYLAKMLKYPVEYGKNLPPYYLQSLQSGRKMDFEYRQIFNTLRGTPEGRKVNHVLLLQNLDYERIGKKIQAQKDPALWAEIEISKPTTAGYFYIAPAYAQSITAMEGTEEELLLLHDQYAQMMADYPNARRAERAELSYEIYRRTLGLDNNYDARYRALVRYSVDRFYEMISNGRQESRQEAVAMLVDLLETGSRNIQDSPEYEALEELANTVGTTILLKSYSDIRTLTAQYAEHKIAFNRLRGMIRDSVAFRDISTVYEALEKLAKILSVYDSSDFTVLIKVLDEADSIIGSVSVGWSDVRSQMQRMIRAERNLLSRRAILDIQILNQDDQPTVGNLHGIVTNKGTMAAEELTLQAFCGELSNNPQYTIKRLMPNAKAVFEIPYTVAEGTQRLQGHLDLNAQSCGNQIDVSRKFDFNIGPTSGESLKYHTYTTDSTGQFIYDPETGTVKNKNFFGRTVETAKMRELVDDSDFVNCHSAVVYGVRRTGKTSLLEYFRAYAQGSRSDCLCIRVDVQKTDETIRAVFIDGVLDNDAIKQALEAGGDHDAFKEKWKCPEDDSAFNPFVLKDFFRELKEMTGKGLILIIDEIDRLFRRMMDNHDEDTLNKLLKVISGILDDVDSKAYIHLVLCGSNWLMYYAAVGYDMQQVFHRMGDYKIMVGRLPKDDVMILLKSANVNFTVDALEMIWEYTGGLVWFVKLLANKAICRAKESGRSWIYPADVFVSLADVLSDGNCQQFYEGCNAGSLERKLIDVMQSQACRKDMYLSMDKLGEILGTDPDDLERAFNSLVRFDIAERSHVNPDKVRFSLDIYRRYFRTVNSSFPRIPEEPAMFERKLDSTAGFMATSVGEDFDDERF